MGKHELLEQYEATSDEGHFVEAKPLYERTLAEASDPQLLLEYGNLLECNGRNSIRRAGDQYDRLQAPISADIRTSSPT